MAPKKETEPQAAEAPTALPKKTAIGDNIPPVVTHPKGTRYCRMKDTANPHVYVMTETNKETRITGLDVRVDPTLWPYYNAAKGERPPHEADMVECDKEGNILAAPLPKSTPA